MCGVFPSQCSANFHTTQWSHCSCSTHVEIDKGRNNTLQQRDVHRTTVPRKVTAQLLLQCLI